MSNATPPPHASSSYAYNYGGRWQGISVEKVINAFLQFLEMDPEKNEVNYDTYGRFHPCYESVADAVYGEVRDTNARRNDTKWLDTLWKQNRRKIRTIVLRKALEQSRITREQLEKCRRKALERAAANYDFIDSLMDHPVDSKNRHRNVRSRDTQVSAAAKLAISRTAKQNGTSKNGQFQSEVTGSTLMRSQGQQSGNPSASNLCVPVPVERSVKLAIFTSNSLKLGQLLSPFEMPNGTMLVLDNDEVFVFQKAQVNLSLHLANGQGQSQVQTVGASPTSTVQPSLNSAGHTPLCESPTAGPCLSQPARTRNKRKSNVPRSTRSKRGNDQSVESELNEASSNDPDNSPNFAGSPIYSLVNGSPIVSNERQKVSSSRARNSRSARRVSGDGGAPDAANVWFDEADVKPLIVAD